MSRQAIGGGPAAAFYDALQAAGVAPASPSELVADGRLHRHRVEGEARGKLSGWHVLHLDPPASGAGGSWRSGVSARWCAKRESALSRGELQALRRRIAADKAKAQAETEARHRNAAARAARLWAEATPADAGHPYAARKGVAPGIARQHAGALVLPVLNFEESLHGLQFIDAQGRKRYLPGTRKQGNFIPTAGLPDGTRPLWICEGWATAGTLAKLQPGACVIAACDAGNLLSVATEARKRWPALDIVVCPDFDEVGRRKGWEAAKQARARILPPPDMVPEGVTDWDDLQAHRRGVAHA